MPALTRVAAGAGSIVASITSGLALGGVVVGILAGMATVVTLVIFVWATVHSARRDRDKELDDAEAKGAKAAEERLLPWLNYWKDQAQGRERTPPDPLL